MPADRVVRRAAVVLGAVAAGCAAVVSLSKIGDYDIWYHLRAGRLFLESGFPATDPFSYTAATQPASVQAWLAGVLYYLAERAGGIPGVQLFNAAVLAATFAVVFATTRLFTAEPGSAFASLLLVVLAVFAARFRLSPRPHVLEYLLLATSLYVLQRFRVRGSSPPWVLCLIQLVWVNIHGSHLLGIALPFLFAAGELAEPLVPARFAAPVTRPEGLGRRVLTLGAIGIANALAKAATPTGWRVFTSWSAATGLATYTSDIGEWQPLSWDLIAGRGAHYTWGFSALAALAILSLAILAARRGLAATDVILVFAFGFLAIAGVRLIPEFAIAVVPIVFGALAPSAARLARGREPVFAAAAAAAAVLAACLAPLDRSYDFGLGKKERIYPDAAVAFAKGAGVAGPVFNSFAFGDYLVYRAPEHKVFIHGRNEVFPAAFYEDYRKAHRDRALFRRLVERYGIEWILLEYTLTDYSGREAMRHLIDDPEWAPVYWDRVSALYVRRNGINARIAEEFGFSSVGPMWFDLSRLDPVIRRGDAGRALAELEEVLRRAPQNEEAWLARADLDYIVGARAEARAALEKALAINDRRAATHSALGLLALVGGDPASGRAHFERALALDPSDPGGVDGMRQLGVLVPQLTGAKMPAGHP